VSGLSSWQRLGLCGIAAAILYLPLLGSPALWEPDEGRYAEIPREMLVSGDYVTPRNDWVRYFEKPPLFYWMTALSMAAVGRNEFAVRLPCALLSIAQVIVAAMLGEAIFGAAAGLLSATALGLSPIFFGFSQFATPDPALSFFVTAGLASFYMATTAGFDSAAGRRWFFAAAAMFAMGTLVKGPVALALGGGIALVYLLLQRRGSEIRRIPWLGCILIYGTIVIPWFATVAIRNPGFLDFFLVHEHLQRYLQSTEHGWGPYFFVIVIAAGTWPWLYFAFPSAMALFRDPDREPQMLASLRFLTVWFLFVVVFFSIPRSKLGSYILPGLPPLAILAGCGIERLARMDPQRVAAILRRFAILNVALGIAGLIAAIFASRRLGSALAFDAGLIAVAISTGAVGCALVGRRGGTNVYRAVGVLAAAVIAALLAGARARADAASIVSYRGMAVEITPYVRRGCVLASYRHFVQSLPFYTGAREALVAYRGELAPFGDSPDAQASFISDEAGLRSLWSSERCVVLVVDRNDLRALVLTLTPAPTAIGCGGKKYALYNRPAPSRPQCAFKLANRP
jgi:4-amino-4-deoxy-L-arabinose transferase-like glycosyltransferase